MISCGTPFESQLQVQVLDGGRDAARLVARRDDDGQLLTAAGSMRSGGQCERSRGTRRR